VPRYLIATDADWIRDEVESALGGPDVSFVRCRNGKQVVPAVVEHEPDLAVLDLQIGTMGGMAVTMSMRLEESGGRLGHVPVILLLDRAPDLHLARRCGAEGWLVKPLDSLRIRRAVAAVLDGEAWQEGIPDWVPPDRRPVEAPQAEPEVAEGAADPEAAHPTEAAAR
jgi:CheY-like chemotaxis protein